MSVHEEQNIGGTAVDRETGEIVETPLAAFRRSAGFQFMFVLHSGLEVGRAIDHPCASAEKFRAAMSEWQPVETAPLNESVLIWIPSPIAEHYGDPVYRGLLKESVGDTKVWVVTGFHFGSDLAQPEYQPSHWMRLPSPPKGAELSFNLRPSSPRAGV